MGAYPTHLAEKETPMTPMNPMNRRMMTFVCCFAAAALTAGCVSQGEMREAKENQQNLSSQLAQAQKERDDWKARYDQLRIESDAAKTKSTDIDKKLADRDSALTAQKAELDATTAKLGEANAQLA